jgi:ERCC4-type nuclease
LGRGRNIKIIIDTREQKPLQFSCETVRKGLSVGDYMAEFADGSLSTVVFERKSINDLFSTLSSGYPRFKREIESSHELRISIIIIVEGSLRRILRGCSHSQRTPISIVYQLFTIRLRHNVETVFCQDRDEMSEYITHYFLAEERNHDDNLSLHKQIGTDKESERSEGAEGSFGAKQETSYNI